MCMIRSSLVILLNVADSRPIPFRLALVPVECSVSRCLPASMLPSDLPVRLPPELPLFLFKDACRVGEFCNIHPNRFKCRRLSHEFFANFWFRNRF